jgi:hypothetical protein
MTESEKLREEAEQKLREVVQGVQSDIEDLDRLMTAWKNGAVDADAALATLKAWDEEGRGGRRFEKMIRDFRAQTPAYFPVLRALANHKAKASK